MQNDMKLSKIAPVAAVLCAATTLSTSFAETPDYYVEWVQPSATFDLSSGVSLSRDVWLSAALQGRHVHHFEVV